MGQSAGAAKPSVDREGFTEEDYQKVIAALGVVDSPTAVVELQAFLARFPARLRPFLRPLFFLISGLEPPATSAPLPAFLAGIARFMAGVDWSELLDAPEANAELVVGLCFWCAHPQLLDAPKEADDPDPIAKILALLRPRSEGAGSAEDGDLSVKRLETLARFLTRSVHTMLAQALLGGPPRPMCPSLESRLLDRESCFLLSGMSAPLHSAESWQPLYRSWKDGRAFSTMIGGCLHYGGLAVMLVSVEGGAVIGAVSNCWSECVAKFGGNSECHLFALKPHVQVLHPKGYSNNFAYFNSKVSTRPKGFGFGGNLGDFRLWIGKDLSQVELCKGDATYGFEPLIPQEEYKVHLEMGIMEVWGIAGKDAYEEQLKQRKIDDDQRTKARTVDRAAFADNEFDRENFLGETFKATAGNRLEGDAAYEAAKERLFEKQ